MPDAERSLALFIDFENLALGFQGRRDRFDVQRVLKRMVEKGKIVVKKAYADWNRFSSYTEALHESAIELIEIPRRAQTGKNSADIRLCVDAMDLAYSKEHIDTFVVVSGDSDFSPLVSKLKELGKHVLGLGMQVSTSELLRDNCDEFIYYEDLEQPQTQAPELDPQLPEAKRKAFMLLLDSLLALRRENKEVLWSSMIKDTMKRIKPAFNESYHGYRTFSALLEDAQEQGLIELETDKRSGTYVVTAFGDEMRAARPHSDRPARHAPLRTDRPRRGTARRGDRRPSRGPARPAATTASDTPDAQAAAPELPAAAPSAEEPKARPAPSADEAKIRPAPPPRPAVEPPARVATPAEDPKPRPVPPRVPPPAPPEETKPKPSPPAEELPRPFGFGILDT